MSAVLFDVPGHAVDDTTSLILASVWESPVNLESRRLCVAAIVRDARTHRGLVDPNRVRAALTDPSGHLRVKSQVLSATYQRLRACRFLAHHGHVISTDRAGNAGKPLNLWRLIEGPTDGSSHP